MKKLVLLVAVFIALLSLFSVCTFAAEIEGQRWHIGLGYEAQSNELTIQSDNNAVGTIYGEYFTFKAPTESVFIDFGFNLTKNLEWNLRFSESGETEVFNSTYIGSYNPGLSMGQRGTLSANGLVSGMSPTSNLVVTNKFSGTTKVSYKTEGWRSELVYQIPYNSDKDRMRFKVIGGTYKSQGTAVTTVTAMSNSEAGGLILFNSSYNATDVVVVPPVTASQGDPTYQIVMPNNSSDHNATHWFWDPNGQNTDTSSYYVKVDRHVILPLAGRVDLCPEYIPVTVTANVTPGSVSLTQAPITINGENKYIDPATGDSYDIIHKADTSVYVDIIGIDGTSNSQTVMSEVTKIRGDYIGISAEYDIVKNLWLEVAGRKVFNGYARNTVTINGISDSVQDDNPEILMLDASLKAKFVKGVTMKFGYQKTFVDYTLRGSDFSDKSSAISLCLDWQW